MHNMNTMLTLNLISAFIHEAKRKRKKHRINTRVRKRESRTARLLKASNTTRSYLMFSSLPILLFPLSVCLSVCFSLLSPKFKVSGCIHCCLGSLAISFSHKFPQPLLDWGFMLHFLAGVKGAEEEEEEEEQGVGWPNIPVALLLCSGMLFSS